jgi:hypothetical protein
MLFKYADAAGAARVFAVTGNPLVKRANERKSIWIFCGENKKPQSWQSTATKI